MSNYSVEDLAHIEYLAVTIYKMYNKDSRSLYVWRGELYTDMFVQSTCDCCGDGYNTVYVAEFPYCRQLYR